MNYPHYGPPPRMAPNHHHQITVHPSTSAGPVMYSDSAKAAEALANQVRELKAAMTRMTSSSGSFAEGEDAGLTKAVLELNLLLELSPPEERPGLERAIKHLSRLVG